MIVVEHDEGPEVGLTGARFGGARARRKRATAPAPEPVAVIADEPVELTGARFGGVARKRRTPPVEVPPVEFTPPAVPPLPGVEPQPVEPVAGTVTVRPYVMTGGRTRSRIELALETLVSAVPRPHAGPQLAEQRAVMALCRQPRAIAEIAALLRLPIGVARVLVGDLAAAGAVAVHRPRPAGDLALMERVLAGLRRL